jgi:hypothetical protein
VNGREDAQYGARRLDYCGVDSSAAKLQGIQCIPWLFRIADFDVAHCVNTSGSGNDDCQRVPTRINFATITAFPPAGPTIARSHRNAGSSSGLSLGSGEKWLRDPVGGRVVPERQVAWIAQVVASRSARSRLVNPKEKIDA